MHPSSQPGHENETHYYMACVCSRCDAHDDWLTLGRYSPMLCMGQLQACKDKAKSQIINMLLTSNIRSLQENLKPQPCNVDLAIARSIWQGLG